jgi:hypothetical protein
MEQLSKDPTEAYHKQIQADIQNSEDLINKNMRKYLLNIKPTAPKLNAHIKTHKQNEPIRLVIDNTQTPAYKTTKFISTQIKTHANLPNTYVTTNSKELAQELHRLPFTEKHRIITLDIKDLYEGLVSKKYQIQKIQNLCNRWCYMS